MSWPHRRKRRGAERALRAERSRTAPERTRSLDLRCAGTNLGRSRAATGRRPTPKMDIKYDQFYIMAMAIKKVAAAKFKEQCLSILDHLEPDGIVITKHGRPVARLLPAERASANLIGALSGRIRVNGDIQSSGVKWDAGG